MSTDKKHKVRTPEAEMLRHFWQVSKQHRRYLLLSGLVPFSALLIGTVLPYLVSRTLASIAIPGDNPYRFAPYLLATAILGAVFNRIGFRSFMNLQARVMAKLQSEALYALLRRSVGFHNNRVAGKLVSDAVDYPGAYNVLSNAIMVATVPFAILVVFGIVLVGMQSWQLGLLLAAMATYAIGSGLHGTRGRTPLRRARHVATKQVVAHLADAITNNQTVTTFAQSEGELEKHITYNTKLRDMRIHDWSTASDDNNVRVSVVVLFQVAFVLMAAWLTRRDPRLLGAGIFALSYTVMVTSRLMEINTTVRAVEDAFLQGTPMTQIMSEQPEILDMPGAEKLQVTAGKISYDDVTFRYDEASTGGKTVFRGLQLDISPGEKIGLVGSSGGGKTTLTRLLLRFEDVTGGKILIDGQNIREVTQDSLRTAIAYVPQEPLLFHRSIFENVSYGVPGASLEKVCEAARLAYADQFIDLLPGGYNTIVGERGVKLSGGQRQRIAIARAILKDAPILVLDEATSALDSESEVLIQKALRDLMKGRTTIVIAHRLSTIQNMDRILVLDDGEITETGTHAELLKLGGQYARLWGHQSGGFILDSHRIPTTPDSPPASTSQFSLVNEPTGSSHPDKLSSESLVGKSGDSAILRESSDDEDE